MKKLGLQHITLWFGIVMVTFVLIAAFAMMFTDAMSDKLYGMKRTGFICVLFAYAIYRSFRIYQVYNAHKNRGEE